MNLFPWERLSAFVESSGVATAGPDWSIPFRQNPVSALWYLTEGRIRLQLGNETVLAEQGDVLLIPTRTPFRGEYESGCWNQQTIFIRFTCYTPERLDGFTLFRPPYKVASACPRSYADRMLQIVEFTRAAATPIERMRANGLLLDALAEVLTPHAAALLPADDADTTKLAKVIRLIGWMEEHLAQRITLADLGKIIHVSGDYINELFRSVVGEPPIHYLNRMRIDKAKQLLLQKNLSVKEIGGLVGFPDALYFSRTFRKLVGIPPSRFEAHMRQL